MKKKDNNSYNMNFANTKISANNTLFDDNLNVDKYYGKGYQYFTWGDNNNISNIIDNYFNYTPYHSKAIMFKLNATIGNGVLVDNQINFDLFQTHNTFKIDEIINKITYDYLMSNSIAVKLITTMDNEHKLIQPIKSYNLRIGTDIDLDTLQVKTYYYSRNWENINDPLNKVRNYKSYIKGTQDDISVYQWIDSINKDAIYPNIPYYSVLPDILTLRKISQYNINCIENGFAALTLLTVKMENDSFINFKNEFQNNIIDASKNGNKTIIINNNSDVVDAIKIDTVPAEIFDNQYEVTRDTCISNILAAHNIMTPEIMGITTKGASLGGDVNKIRESYKLFEDKVLVPIRTTIIKQVNHILEIGNWGFKITGFDIPTDAIDGNGISGNNSANA